MPRVCAHGRLCRALRRALCRTGPRGAAVGASSSPGGSFPPLPHSSPALPSATASSRVNPRDGGTTSCPFSSARRWVKDLQKQHASWPISPQARGPTGGTTAGWTQQRVPLPSALPRPRPVPGVPAAAGHSTELCCVPAKRAAATGGRGDGPEPGSPKQQRGRCPAGRSRSTAVLPINVGHC